MGKKRADKVAKAAVQNTTELKERAQKALKVLVEHKKADPMMDKMARSGTFMDRINALSYGFLNEPHTNIAYLEELVHLMDDGTRHHLHDLMKHLLDVFLEVLPKDRELIRFDERKFEGKITDGALVMALYEDKLKPLYLRYLRNVEKMSYDTIVKRRLDAMRTLFKLLTDKPEQSSVILAIIVSKIGDPEKKVSSEAVHLLARTLGIHHDKAVDVAIAVDKFMQSGLKMTSLKHCLTFMSQMSLTKKMPIADQLVGTYFTVFMTQLKLRELGHYSASAIQESIKLADAKKGRELAKKTKKPRKGKKKPAAAADETRGADDLSYDPAIVALVLKGLARAGPFIADKKKALARFETHANALFELARTSPLATSIACLSFLMEIADPGTPMFQHIVLLTYRLLLSPELHHTAHGTELVGLVAKIVLADKELERSAALVKRMLQVTMIEPSALLCEAVIRLPPILRQRKEIGAMLMATARTVELEVDEEDGLILNVAAHQPEPESAETADSDDDEAKAKRADPSAVTAYDPVCPNPRLSGSNRVALWEAHALTRHYHPSVRAITDELARKGKIGFKGTPSVDFAFIQYLNRFADKKAKARVGVDAPGISHVGVPVKRKAAGLDDVEEFFKTFEQVKTTRESTKVQWNVEDDDEYMEIMEQEMEKIDDEYM
ncbi:CBF/Mak21 family [Carpediemonas membranifera]|uniref:CBF/Mak21 family n=1 Tax=Carpediemonas membranifera TaxID=201153 RepID=A0A8J6ATP8_9EUKA|nr:CBF/Mak21 family [Carpediemonas membranifera]|eukprot:KAG9393868.1 CBF/Mak21 family [Carpediemonas membranifera]